ncbi:BQ2448_5549 [Microbotryum intermedium]|uniref:chitin deacetylase n=1 Tax=Microbotryum intermedium TaxID=269621 RepID=A0A238F4W8_9BASI|nr:BQ2448_5549 [Microbotryum intermedium]
MLTRSSFFAVAALLAVSWAQLDQRSQAAIKDPVKECTAYNYAPLAAFQSSYPTVWTTADLQHAGVTDSAKNLFATISANLPPIAPRGTSDGDWSNVNYSTAEDPACWWTSTQCTTPKLSGLPPDITHCEQPAALGYTLDDGPNCSHNAYYDYLKDQKQKATLFYVGSNVMDWPLQAQRGLVDGHEICAHSWSHRYMTSLSNEQAFAEIYYSKKIIKDVLGITVLCFRPPFGDTDNRIRVITHALGMRTVFLLFRWSYDTVDWQVEQLGNAAIDKNYETLISKATAQTGQMNLAHELNAATMNISQTWLPALQKTYTGGVMPVSAYYPLLHVLHYTQLVTFALTQLTVCRGTVQPYLETSATFPSYDQWQKGIREVTIPVPSPATSADDGISWGFSDGDGAQGNGGNGSLPGNGQAVHGASGEDGSDDSSASSGGDESSDINGNGGGGDDDASDDDDENDDDDDTLGSGDTTTTSQGDAGMTTTGTMTDGTTLPKGGINNLGGSSRTLNNSTLTPATKLVAAGKRATGEGSLVRTCVLGIGVGLAMMMVFYF